MARLKAEQRPLSTPHGSCMGAAYAWEGGQYCAIHTARGVVGCGIYDMGCADEFDMAFAIAKGTPGHPLREPEDLYEAKVVQVSRAAMALGIQTGMTGMQALGRLLTPAVSAGHDGVHDTPLFVADELSAADRQRLDQDGHLVLPGLLTAQASEALVEALQAIHNMMPGDRHYPPNHYAAQHNDYLAELIHHPQLLRLARAALGPEIRYDHCFTLSRDGGDRGAGWHSHAYSEKDESLGFLRIFFYVSGFEVGDGNLKVVPGSHHFRDPAIGAGSDRDLTSGWMKDRLHPVTGEPLRIEELSAPPGSVALLWTHAAHAVNARQPGSDTRWCVVYGYRNPGAASPARRITPEFITHFDDPEGLLGP